MPELPTNAPQRNFPKLKGPWQTPEFQILWCRIWSFYGMEAAVWKQQFVYELAAFKSYLNSLPSDCCTKETTSESEDIFIFTGFTIKIKLSRGCTVTILLHDNDEEFKQTHSFDFIPVEPILTQTIVELNVMLKKLNINFRLTEFLDYYKADSGFYEDKTPPIMPEAFINLSSQVIRLAMECSCHYPAFVPRVFFESSLEDIEEIDESEYDSILDSLIDSDLVQTNDQEEYMIKEAYVPFLEYLLNCLEEGEDFDSLIDRVRNSTKPANSDAA